MSTGYTSNPMMLPLMGYLPLLHKVGEGLDDLHKKFMENGLDNESVKKVVDGCFSTVGAAHHMFLYILNEAAADPTLVECLCGILEPLAREIKKKDEKEKEDRVTEEVNKALYNTPTTADKYRKEITSLQEGIRERMLSLPKEHEDLKENCRRLLEAVDGKLSMESISTFEYKTDIAGLTEVTRHLDAVIGNQ